jgi:hypothetical protein
MEFVEAVGDPGRDYQEVGCFSANNAIHVDESLGITGALSTKGKCIQVLWRRGHARALSFKNASANFDIASF